MGAVDVEDTISTVLANVEQAMRTDLADAFGSVLDTLVENVDGYEDANGEGPDGYAEDAVDGLGMEEDEDGSEETRDVMVGLVADAWRAGYDACMDKLRDAVESAKWAGYRPGKPA